MADGIDPVEVVKREYQQRADMELSISRDMIDNDSRDGIDDLLLPIGPATAGLVATLINESEARRVLEVGTSYGYSTVWLAEAVRNTGGKVTTLELDQKKVDYAREQLTKAALVDFVDFRVGDALETIESLAGPFDFVLIDLWKDKYVPTFDLVYPKLAEGAVIVADNMLYPDRARADANRYRARVRQAKDMTSVLLEVGSGIEVSRYR